MNINLKFSAVILSAFCLMGCFGSKPFQPPPPTYTKWQKPGISVEEVKKSMLDCGYPTPLGAGTQATNNEIALMDLCMEKRGFTYTGRFGNFCTQYPTLPACQPTTHDLELKNKRR